MIGRRALIAGALASPLAAAMAQAAPGRASSTEYFVLIHAQGGWDVTLFADPRFEAVGAMMPATTANQDVRGLRLWADGPAAGVDKSFRPVIPKGRDVAFGPGIGDLLDIFDRVTILNGVAMSTVAHPDGAAFAISGRHLVGGRPVASSLDAVLADAFGPTQMLPVVSVAFPSSFVGQRLGPHAIPIETANIDGLGAALTRSDHTTNADDRADVARLLEAEATRTARLSTYPQRSVAMSAQFGALARLSREGVGGLFGNAALRKAYPSLPWTGRAGPATQSAAFALEAVRRDIARVVAFSMGGFDTHASNYRQHGAALQDLFQLVTAMVRVFDDVPHPTVSGHKLADHVHVLVFSEFCRTPQLNLNGGRDHYPNNSMVLLSPRFRGGLVAGRTDPGELLPIATRRFALGERAVTPPDVLATFLHAVGVDPAPHVRDGELMPELLRS